VAALGRGLAGPWRAEQKTAALAAWLVLAGHMHFHAVPARQRGS
jgi:hypothetical protein